MKRVILVFLAVMALAFIWFQSVVPENRSDHESIWFTEAVVNPLLGRMGWGAIESRVVRKAAHVSEFFVLSFLSVFIWKGRFVPSVYTGFTAAFVDESVQLVADRGALISDVWIDLIGVFSGAAVGWTIWKIASLMKGHMRKSKAGKERKMDDE